MYEKMLIPSNFVYVKDSSAKTVPTTHRISEFWYTLNLKILCV